jgi:hypothetical protein
LIPVDSPPLLAAGERWNFDIISVVRRSERNASVDLDQRSSGSTFGHSHGLACIGKCAGINYQSTMGHRWDRSRLEKLRVRLQWRANGTVPIKPRGMHEQTYQRILGMLAYREAIRKQGTSYVRKYRPDQHRAHLWRQCRNRFVEHGGWPVR